MVRLISWRTYVHSEAKTSRVFEAKDVQKANNINFLWKILRYTLLKITDDLFSHRSLISYISV